MRVGGWGCQTVARHMERILVAAFTATRLTRRAGEPRGSYTNTGWLFTGLPVSRKGQEDSMEVLTGAADRGGCA